MVEWSLMIAAIALIYWVSSGILIKLTRPVGSNRPSVRIKSVVPPCGDYRK